MVKRKLDIDLDNQKVLHFLNLAFSDYLASRFLLNNCFLEHGCMLASTAVEKYIKSVIGIYGISNQSHLSPALFRLLQHNVPELYEDLNIDFLKFLEKSFKLRYALTNSAGLSIVINQYKTLLELDQLVHKLECGLGIIVNGEKIPTPYQSAIKENNEKLLFNNIPLNHAEFPKFVRQLNKIMELKIEDNFNVIRAEYETDGVNLATAFMQKPELSMYKQEFKLTLG